MKKMNLFNAGMLFFLSAMTCFAQDTPPDWNQLSRQPDANFYTIREQVQEYFASHPEAMEENPDEAEKREGNDLSFRNYSRWESFWNSRVSANSLETAGQFTTLQNAYFSYSQNPICQSMGPVESAWVLLGPTEMPEQNMGYVSVVERDPGNPGLIYAGTNNSGLWKTTNGGINWTCITDVVRYPGLGIRDLLIDPGNSNTLYIATGNSRTEYGIGMLKSTDGGNTWNTTGLSFIPSAKIFVGEMRMDPINNSVIFALTTDKIYKTTDAGATWNGILTIPAQPCWQHQSFRDLELLPGNPSVVFVSMVDENACNGGANMFRSTDGGISWNDITPAASLERIEMAVTPASPNKVFVMYNSVPMQAAYRRDYDNVSGWGTPQTNSTNIGFYFHRYEISPTDENVRYFGETVAYKTTNGGNSWFPISTYGGPTTHADIRAINILAGSMLNTGGVNDEILMGTDGGVSYTTDGGNSWSNLNGNGLSITQYYGIGNSDALPSVFAGGTQDNGLYTYNNGTWTIDVVGDAYEVVIDHTNPQYMYACSNGGAISMERSVNGGATWSNMTTPGDTAAFSNRPFQMNELNHALYIGYHDVYVCTNPQSATVTWAALSNFTGYGVPAGKRILSMAVAPSDPNYIYVAFEEPTISNPTNNKWFMTSDHGVTWNDIGAGFSSLHWTEITDMVVHPYDPLRIWAITGGFWPNSSGIVDHKVFYSDDGGVTWSDHSQGLPDLPGNTIVYEKGSNDGLYFGNDVGVFYRNAAMSQWECFSFLLPACQVLDMEINYGTNVIRAATFGRGVWQSHLACPVGYNLIISGTASTDAFHEAQNKIQSDQIITGGKINFRAGASVELVPGFSSTTSGYFKAYIHPCDVPGNSNLSKTRQYDGAETKEIIEPDAEELLPVKVYPNPNTGTFTVEFDFDGKEADILLLDIQGKLVKKYEQVKQSVQVNAEGLQSGIYPLIVVSTDHQHYHVTRVNIVH